MEAKKKQKGRTYVKEPALSFTVSMKAKQRKVWLKLAKEAGVGPSAYAIKMMGL